MERAEYNTGPSGQLANQTWLRGSKKHTGEIDTVIARFNARPKKGEDSKKAISAEAFRVKNLTRMDQGTDVPEFTKQAYTESAAQWNRTRWRGLADLNKFKHFAEWISGEEKHKYSREAKFDLLVEDNVKTAFRHDMILYYKNEHKIVTTWDEVAVTDQAIFEKAGIGQEMFDGILDAIVDADLATSQPVRKKMTQQPAWWNEITESGSSAPSSSRNSSYTSEPEESEEIWEVAGGDVIQSKASTEMEGKLAAAGFKNPMVREFAGDLYLYMDNPNGHVKTALKLGRTDQEGVHYIGKRDPSPTLLERAAKPSVQTHSETSFAQLQELLAKQ